MPQPPQPTNDATSNVITCLILVYFLKVLSLSRLLLDCTTVSTVNDIVLGGPTSSTGCSGLKSLPKIAESNARDSYQFYHTTKGRK